ncbi:transcriptional regulator SUPERMAN-like [Cynara cardunculus var. scolymus]|uniref:C2H2-type domain-containing protein n=1 Tax=Cynara cardunculus var. scolymus TaxID=59895 RepID=A0A118JWJ9_CYNCS|nr:transcriptional regulator SUPERMAN-like [Cynara cardunculus var. scolymus]KVH94330.1 hypothetical protein Ccrd_003617 [Cynara cardunculus var. scolymus]
MESIATDDHDEDDQPTNSSDQEIDQDDHVLGTNHGGRSYECVFCKRGFTTAQALGGHMNIHRKDRAKNSNRSSYSSSNNRSSNYKQDDDDHGCYSGPRFFQPVFASYPPSYLSATPANHHQEGRQLHYFSSTSGDLRPMNYENNHQDHDQVITSASREEERRRISLQFGWSNAEDEDSERRIRGGDKQDELDLELRLGHDP